MSSSLVLLELIKEKEKIEDLIKINNINIDIYKNRKQIANNLSEIGEYETQISKITKLSNKYKIDIIKINENIEDKLFLDKQRNKYINIETLELKVKNQELKIKNLESTYLISIILLLSYHCYYYYKK
jgi:hypothetical protein